MNRKKLVLGVALLGLAATAGYAVRAVAAGIPATNALTYAGVLEDATGPITGTHNIQVILYDAATAGNLLCQSTTAPLSIVDGHFSVQLPDLCTTKVGLNAEAWADVLVDGSDTGRTKLGAVPYAVEANHATNADTAGAAGGTLATTISTLQSQVSALQKAKPVFQVRNSTSTVAEGSTIVWDAVDIDNSSGYSTSTGLYTIPVAGTYEFYFDLLMPNAPAGEYRYGILHNGSLVHTTITYKSTAGTWQSLYGALTIKCAVGDTVGVEFVSGSGNTYNDALYNVFYGHML